tara:strand:+ start:134 stop:265 length:132 start_codon:yes stop_codon:yes gene_type:complete
VIDIYRCNLTDIISDMIIKAHVIGNDGECSKLTIRITIMELSL